MNGREAPRIARWPRSGTFLGLAVTIAVIAALHLVGRGAPDLGQVAPVLVLAVVFAALRGGTVPGLLSAALVGAYGLYLSTLPGAPGGFLTFLLVAAAAALLVGIYRSRTASARQERALRWRAEEAEQHFRFISDACGELASSLDPHETLQRFAELVAFSWADWCVIDLVQEDGSVVRTATAHRDPELAPLVTELAAFPPTRRSAGPIDRVLRSNRPELIPRVTDDVIRAGMRDRRHEAIIRRLDPTSSMVVPLSARERVLGTISLFRSGDAPPYGDEEMGMAQELAERAALALDNARLYTRAQEANRAKADFLAVMSHELRTPLSAILGFTDILDEGIPGPVNDLQREQLGRVRASALHLLQLIEEILTFARMEAGREEFRPSPVRLCDVVGQAVDMVAPAAQEKRIELRVERPTGEDDGFRTDAGKLRQILVNLLSNAVKFTDEGEVSVAFHRNGEGAVFVVRDTGMGIAEDHLEAIFEPFWQLEEVRTRRAGGTGLGLAVSRRLTDLLGGEISVESRQGEGSTFRLLVPDVRNGSNGDG
jgi:signal transduction histidine kinase